MAQTEVSMGDAELDALMAELDAETADMVIKPVTAAPAVVVAESAEVLPELAPLVPEPEPAPRVDKEAAIPEAVAAQAEKDSALYEEIRKIAQAQRELEEAQKQAAAATPVAAPVALVPTPVAAPEPVAEPAPVAAPRTATALQFYIDTNDFAKDIAVSDTTLDACMMNQASLRAHYGFAHARSEGQSSRTKLSVDVAIAQLYDKHRKEFALDPSIKVTEKMVENAVQQDPKYRQLKNRAIEAEEIAAVNKAAVEAMKDRRDMIIQAGADRRDEYKGQARIMAQTDERVSLSARALAAVQK